MIRRHHILIFVLLFITSVTLFSQELCEVPVPPVLTSVSVQPETRSTVLKWNPSPSTGIAAYLVYAFHDENGTTRGDINDTIWNPAATSYSFSSNVINYYSVSYVVSSFRRPNCASAFSNVLSTIFLKAEADTCNRMIKISWNRYDSIPVKVIDYSVLVSLNGGVYEEAAKVDKKENSFSIRNFLTNSDYCIIVRANLEGSSFSSSNRVCVNTEMEKPPQWINADYASTVDGAGVALSFTVDPGSEMNYFSLERQNASSVSFTEIAMITTNTGVFSVTFTDETADRQKVNYYRLSAMKCGQHVISSNLASNIVLKGVTQGDDIILTWNKYREWIGDVSSYKLFMNTGNGFIEKAVIEPGDTLFTIPVQDVMMETLTGNVCFYISASEENNPHNISGESRSNEICITIDEKLTVPNLFTPDGDGLNDLFKPVVTFRPSAYHLIISNRQGRILFESRNSDEAWNGTDNGQAIPAGVYFWFIRTRAPSGLNISRTGTVTILKNR